MADAAFITTLADQVVSDLNDGTFSISGLGATRAYSPRIELEKSDELVVTVVPAGWVQIPDNRLDWQYIYEVHIGVQYKFKGGKENIVVDKYVLLVQEICDKFRNTAPAITGENGIVLEEVTVPQLWIPEHFEKGQFTSVVVLRFRTVK